jgi:putative effector of murein hydrolase LrgA (UPF0299 family)
MACILLKHQYHERQRKAKELFQIKGNKRLKAKCNTLASEMLFCFVVVVAVFKLLNVFGTRNIWIVFGLKIGYFPD